MKMGRIARGARLRDGPRMFSTDRGVRRVTALRRVWGDHRMRYKKLTQQEVGINKMNHLRLLVS
jgi:hypothetical protein